MGRAVIVAVLSAVQGAEGKCENDKNQILANEGNVKTAVIATWVDTEIAWIKKVIELN